VGFQGEDPEPNHPITIEERCELIEGSVRGININLLNVDESVARIHDHLTADRNPENEQGPEPEPPGWQKALRSPAMFGAIVGTFLGWLGVLAAHSIFVTPIQEGKADVWITPEVGSTVEIVESFFGNYFVNENAAGAITVQSKVDKHQRVCGRYTWSRPAAKMQVSTHLTCIELGPYERKEFWLQWESLELARTIDCFGNYATNQHGPAGQAAQKELERRNKAAPCVEATPEIIPMPESEE